MKKKIIDSAIIIIGLILIAYIWLLLFKNLPLGLFLVIIGAIFTKIANFPTSKSEQAVGTLGSWLYPIGIGITFYKQGFIWGLISIFLALCIYRMSTN